MNARSNHPDTMPIGRALQNLLSDFKVLARDTRELLRQTAGQTGEQITNLRERTRDALESVEPRLSPLQERLTEYGRHAAEASAEHLRAHRWSTVAGAAAIGLAIAAIIAWQNEGASDE